MKYGIIVYNRSNTINIGDDIQILAIKELYERNGISFDELVKIDFRNLVTYDGDEVIVPISFPFFGYNQIGNITCFSKKIRPVFLGLSLLYTNLSKDDYEYLKKYEPIGCRDEHTYLGLKKQGIDAYLNGCLTLTLNKRNRVVGDTIYCVDVYDEFKSYIPKSLTSNMISNSHILHIDNNIDTIEYANKRLEEYALKAKLVITSRFHCALPCIAMGIPVIFINKSYDNRFTWLEDIVHIYIPDEWEKIDWNAKTINISFVQKIMNKIFEDRIFNNNCSMKNINKLAGFYEKRHKRNYEIEGMGQYINWLADNWNNNLPKKYVVWGITQYTSFLIDYIKEHYPNAALTDVVDSNKKIKWGGLYTKQINEVHNLNNKYIFITALAAVKDATKKLKELNVDFKKVSLYKTIGIK